MCKKIFLDAPNVGCLEKEYLAKAIDGGFVSTIGGYVSEFEEKFAHFLGAKKAMSTQSGTAALHMSLYECGIGGGDEVIAPALTFVASVNPILYVGARPVIVDVDPETWTIDPKEIRKAITPATKAIIPVHLYGNPCDMDSITAIAREHGLHIIEDATESLGATYDGKQTGTFGDFGCFSFNGNKVITTGGGGMVVGSDESKLEHIKLLTNQGRDCSNGCCHTEIGFNYRMTNLEAALGLAQMDKLDTFRARKKAFSNIYRQQLKDVKCIDFQKEHEDAESSWWLSCVILEEGTDIDSLQKELSNKDIPTRRVFMPVVEFPPYRTYKQRGCETSYRIYERGLCLPGSTLNSEEDIYYVCEALKELL
jgi:perosamine synthetase